MKRLGIASSALTVLMALVAPLLAHNFWIEPQDFTPELEGRLTATLKVGSFGDVETYARNPYHLREFYLLTPEGKRMPLVGQPGQDPAGIIGHVPQGLSWLVYESTFTALELPPGKFESYLKIEGLERIIALRAELGESLRNGRERYARCAKSMVRTDSAPGPHDQVVGLPFELVLGRDPLQRPATPAGEVALLPVKLLAGGKPAVHAQVTLELLGAPLDQQTYLVQRTDEAGVAHFPWPVAGAWLLGSVHVERAQEADDNEWQTYFASLTFQVPEPVPLAAQDG